MGKRRRWVILLLLVLAATGGGMYWYAEDLFVPVPVYALDGEPVALLPPETVVGDTPPEGWTHVILKSEPRVHSGAVEKLFDWEKKYVSFLFMTTVARVKDQGTRFRAHYMLEEVALGLGTTVKGKDIILSPESQAQSGADLALPFRLILKGAYLKQQEARYVIHGTTFVLFDTPVLMQRPDGHHEILFRYALLVDPNSGRLDTLVWGIDRKNVVDPVVGPIEWLAPGTIDPAPVHVEAREFVLGRPGPNAFAAERLPHGQRQLPISINLGPLLSQERYTPKEAQELHRALLRLMHQTAPTGGLP